MEPEHPARTPLDHPFVDLVVETSREGRLSDDGWDGADVRLVPAV
jgi:hypothetical protein